MKGIVAGIITVGIRKGAYSGLLPQEAPVMIAKQGAGSSVFLFLLWQALQKELPRATKR